MAAAVIVGGAFVAVIMYNVPGVVAFVLGGSVAAAFFVIVGCRVNHHMQHFY